MNRSDGYRQHSSCPEDKASKSLLINCSLDREVYDLTLQIAGLSIDANQEVERKIDENASILFHLAEDGRLLAASGLGIGNRAARDVRLAEMLIAKQVRPERASLSDPAFKLKSLLSAMS